jgi:hypothetical protein
MNQPSTLPRITVVEPLDDHNLRLTFSDGLVRDVDLSSLMHGPLGEPLRDPDYFRQVRIDEEARTIVWPNAGCVPRRGSVIRRLAA